LVRPELESNVLPVDVTALAQVLPKQPPKPVGARSANHQDADDRYFGLLRRARTWPNGRRAAEKREEVASPQQQAVPVVAILHPRLPSGRRRGDDVGSEA
jgi:hypothetical protein